MTIEFNGTLSDECRNAARKATWRIILIVLSVVCLPFIILFIALSVTQLWAYSLMLIPIAYLLICAAFPPNTKIYRLIYRKSIKANSDLPHRVVVEDDCIWAEGVQTDDTRSLDQVSKVIDWGDWYEICFFFPHKSRMFICQKNLICQGTLEDFEALFADQLVRKGSPSVRP